MALMSSTDAEGVIFDMITLALAAPAIEIDRLEEGIEVG